LILFLDIGFRDRGLVLPSLFLLMVFIAGAEILLYLFVIDTSVPVPLRGSICVITTTGSCLCVRRKDSQRFTAAYDHIRLLDLNCPYVTTRAGLKSYAGLASRRPYRRRYISPNTRALPQKVLSLFVRWCSAVCLFWSCWREEFGPSAQQHMRSVSLAVSYCLCISSAWIALLLDILVAMSLKPCMCFSCIDSSVHSRYQS
jgi:hypothetical protein